jgi:hypothetical protein
VCRLQENKDGLILNRTRKLLVCVDVDLLCLNINTIMINRENILGYVQTWTLSLKIFRNIVCIQFSYFISELFRDSQT